MNEVVTPGWGRRSCRYSDISTAQWRSAWVGRVPAACAQAPAQCRSQPLHPQTWLNVQSQLQPLTHLQLRSQPQLEYTSSPDLSLTNQTSAPS